MWIECTDCPVRTTHCGDCMVTALLATISVGPAQAPERGSPRGDRVLGAPSEVAPGVSRGPEIFPATPASVRVDLDRRERAAVTELVCAGLVSAETAASAWAEVEVPAAQRWAGLGPSSATG